MQWSPVNASLFSTITSGGILTLWDLSKSTLEAQDSFNVLKDPSGGRGGDVNSGNNGNGGNLVALNKLVWSTDGLSLYVGDTKGNVRQIDVKESVAKAKPGDEGRMQMLLNAKKVVDDHDKNGSNVVANDDDDDENN